MPLTDYTLGRALARLFREAENHGFKGWGRDDCWNDTRIAIPVEDGWTSVGVGPGGQYTSDPYYCYDNHDWDVKIDCPERPGKRIAHLHCLAEVAAHGTEAKVRIVGLVRDVEIGRGICWAPVTDWLPLPAFDAPEMEWKRVMWAMDEIVATAYSALLAEGLSYILVDVEPRDLPTVDGRECPCDSCQQTAAYLQLTGGDVGSAVAMDARIIELNAKLAEVNPGLTFCLHVEVRPVEDDLPLLGVPTAIATCEDAAGSLLWAMGGETAQEAIDGIEAWAWALLVTDLAARKGLGRGEA
jgi:hypothetical protein